MSSIGIKNGRSTSRCGVGMYSSTARINSSIMPSAALSSLSNAFNAETRTTGISSPGKSYSLSNSRTSNSTNSSNSSSSTMSTLFKATTMYGTPTCRASNMCSPRLRHRPVRRVHHQDRPVHLRRPGDHVLDVVRVPRTVHVRVVPVARLILHVRRRDRDPPLALLRRVVDRIERARLVRRVVLRQHLRDRRRQRRLAVVYVPYRAHVHMRLRSIKLLFRHLVPPLTDSKLCAELLVDGEGFEPS